MFMRLGTAILLGSLVTIGSACADPALDPDRFADFGATTSAALAAVEPAPVLEAEARDLVLSALAPENFFYPDPEAVAALVAENLAEIAPLPPAQIAFADMSPVDLSDFEQSAFAQVAGPVASPIDVAEALSSEHFLDLRDEETLAWIAEDLTAADIVETGSIGVASVMPVTGDHREFMDEDGPAAR
jgi:hypothetical protein